MHFLQFKQADSSSSNKDSLGLPRQCGLRLVSVDKGNGGSAMSKDMSCNVRFTRALHHYTYVHVALAAEE
jgi:hypothetical protein